MFRWVGEGAPQRIIVTRTPRETSVQWEDTTSLPSAKNVAINLSFFRASDARREVRRAEGTLNGAIAQPGAQREARTLRPRVYPSRQSDPSPPMNRSNTETPVRSHLDREDFF